MRLDEERALAQIDDLHDPDQLRTMIENATGKSDCVVQAAFRRLVARSAAHAQGSVEHDCWSMIHTIEELRRAQGRSWRMNRLRQKVAVDGEVEALRYCASKRTDGFQEVLDLGLPELTAEAIVLRHPQVFGEPTRATAERRLKEAGVYSSPTE
ncbi:hypothetical protein D3C71_316480 [compost metagenome]